jgi:hypothetical protein
MLLLNSFSGDPECLQHAIMVEEQIEQPAAALPAVAQTQAATPAAAPSNVKLLQFWPQASVAWFAQAECVFKPRG